MVADVNEPTGRPSQEQIEDAVTTTLVGWGREFDMFQKFWWMDWRKMMGDVVEAMRTGEAVVYEDDETDSHDRRADDDPSLVATSSPCSASHSIRSAPASGFLRGTVRSAATAPSTSSLPASSSACAAPPNWSSSAPACDRLGDQFF